VKEAQARREAARYGLRLQKHRGEDQYLVVDATINGVVSNGWITLAEVEAFLRQDA
jgi:hypothetical protein